MSAAPVFNPVEYMRDQRTNEARASQAEAQLRRLHIVAGLNYVGLIAACLAWGTPEAFKRFVAMQVLVLYLHYSCEVSGRPLRADLLRNPLERNKLVRCGDLQERVFWWYYGIIGYTWVLLWATLYTGNLKILRAWWLVPAVGIYFFVKNLIVGWYIPWKRTKRASFTTKIAHSDVVSK